MKKDLREHLLEPDGFASRFRFIVRGERAYVNYDGRCVGRQCVEAIMEVCRIHLNDLADEDAEIFNEWVDREEEKERGAQTEPLKLEIGFVYLCTSTLHAFTKIGFSTQPQAREGTLQAEDPSLTMIAKYEGTVKDEKWLHRHFRDKRKRGEWFDLSAEDIASIKRSMTGLVE